MVEYKLENAHKIRSVGQLRNFNPSHNYNKLN